MEFRKNAETTIHSAKLCALACELNRVSSLFCESSELGFKKGKQRRQQMALLEATEVRENFEDHVKAMIAARSSGAVGGRGRRAEPIDLESEEEEVEPKAKQKKVKTVKSEPLATQFPTRLH